MFEEDVVARKRLAKLLARESDARLAIISTIFKDVAIKVVLMGLDRSLEKGLKSLEKSLERRFPGSYGMLMAWKRELQGSRRGLLVLRSVSTQCPSIC